MSTTMRAKFRVTKVERFEESDRVMMTPVCKSGAYPPDGSDEDNTFAKFSPSGELTLSITNPNLVGKIVPGEKYYLDFTPVPEPKKEVKAEEKA